MAQVVFLPGDALHRHFGVQILPLLQGVLGRSMAIVRSPPKPSVVVRIAMISSKAFGMAPGDAHTGGSYAAAMLELQQAATRANTTSPSIQTQKMRVCVTTQGSHVQ